MAKACCRCGAIAGLSWGSVLMPGFVLFRKSEPLAPVARESLSSLTSPTITVLAQAERPLVPLAR